MAIKPIITPETTDIIWDADNTLWDWVTYAVHAYEAMSNCIAEETGIPEPKVAAAMKKFYSDVGTMENEFLIQGLTSMGLFKKIQKFDMDNLIDKAQSIFAHVRAKHIKLYDHIEEILNKLHERGIKNHLLTDAPGTQAAMRLTHFHLEKYFTSINAMRAADPKTLPKKFKDRKLAGKYKHPFLIRIMDDPKPDTNIEKITNLTRSQITTQVINVGDSPQKDGGISIKNGNKCIIARYGMAKPELLKRLLRFAPLTTAGQNVSMEQKHNLNTLPKNITIVNSTREMAAALDIQLNME